MILTIYWKGCPASYGEFEVVLSEKVPTSEEIPLWKEDLAGKAQRPTAGVTCRAVQSLQRSLPRHGPPSNR